MLARFHFCKLGILNMWKVILTVGAMSIVGLSQSAGILKIEPTDDDEKYIEIIVNETESAIPDPPTWSKQASIFRRAFMEATRLPARPNRRFGSVDDDKEETLKQKISVLVQTTMHDTDYKMKFVNAMKERYKEDGKYKIGFILVMIKKSREVLNELFNVAVKHRDQWKVLEQLKIFELIVHTNVDTTHLVRQLMENHMEVKNGTDSAALSNARVLRMNADHGRGFNLASMAITPSEAKPVELSLKFRGPPENSKISPTKPKGLPSY